MLDRPGRVATLGTACSAGTWPRCCAAPPTAVARPGWWWSATAPREWSRSGRHTGRTDLPLLDDGRLEAQELGRRLAGHDSPSSCASPLRRARETCEIAGFGPEAAGVRRPAGVGLRRLRGEDDRRHPGAAARVVLVARRGAGRRDGRRRSGPVPTGSSPWSGTGPGTSSPSPTRHVLRVVAARWVALAPAAGAVVHAGAGHHQRAGVGARRRPWSPGGTTRRAIRSLTGPGEPSARRGAAVEAAGDRQSVQRPGRGGVPPARDTMSSRVKESRCPRMCSPTSDQTVSKMHWPSCSQAPFSWGLPEVAGHDGPVDGAHDLPEGDLLGRAGEHVPAARRHAWTAPGPHL